MLYVWGFGGWFPWDRMTQDQYKSLSERDRIFADLLTAIEAGIEKLNRTLDLEIKEAHD